MLGPYKDEVAPNLVLEISTASTLTGESVSSTDTPLSRQILVLDKTIPRMVSILSEGCYKTAKDVRGTEKYQMNIEEWAATETNRSFHLMSENDDKVEVWEDSDNEKLGNTY